MSPALTKPTLSAHSSRELHLPDAKAFLGEVTFCNTIVLQEVCEKLRAQLEALSTPLLPSADIRAIQEKLSSLLRAPNLGKTAKYTLARLMSDLDAADVSHKSRIPIQITDRWPQVTQVRTPLQMRAQGPKTVLLHGGDIHFPYGVPYNGALPGFRGQDPADIATNFCADLELFGKQNGFPEKFLGTHLKPEENFIRRTLGALELWSEEPGVILLWDIDSTLGDRASILHRSGKFIDTWLFRPSLNPLLQHIAKTFPQLRHGILSSRSTEDIATVLPYLPAPPRFWSSGCVLSTFPLRNACWDYMMKFGSDLPIKTDYQMVGVDMNANIKLIGFERLMRSLMNVRLIDDIKVKGLDQSIFKGHIVAVDEQKRFDTEISCRGIISYWGEYLLSRSCDKFRLEHHD